MRPPETPPPAPVLLATAPPAVPVPAIAAVSPEPPSSADGEAASSTRAAELARRMRGTVPTRSGIETKPSPGIDWATGQVATADRAADAGHGPRATAAGVRFALESTSATEVALVGDFNGWLPGQCPLPRREGSGRFELTLPLGRGLYRYRFVVDGRETLDPDNPRRETGPDGRPASVVEVSTR